MKTGNRAVLLFLAMIVGTALAIDPAFAHRFNVALVIPQSNAAPDQARQIRAGFMLATKERDSHPDQESDGHLGGLDVYVRVIDGNGDVAAHIGRIAKQGAPHIVAVFGSETMLLPIGGILGGKKIALLAPGETPFSEPERPVVAAFIALFEREYGLRPSSWAAQGYNAARRIDVAVRAHGGVGDIESLRRSFRKTARGFAW
jgi:hypothetical protein